MANSYNLPLAPTLPGVDPQASPLPVFSSVKQQQAPQRAFLDLAPLSKTLQGLQDFGDEDLRKQQEKEAAAALTQLEKEAGGNRDLVRQKIESGEIKAFQTTWGRQYAIGQDVAAVAQDAYTEALPHLQEWANATNPTTGKLEPPTDLTKQFEDVWGRVSKDVWSVSTKEGQELAQKYKKDAYDRLLGKYATLRDKSFQDHAEMQYQNRLGEQVRLTLASPITGQSLGDLFKYFRDEQSKANDFNVIQARNLSFSALKNALIAFPDHAQARALIAHLQDLPLGPEGSKLSNDNAAKADLAELDTRLSGKIDEDELRKATLRATRAHQQAQDAVAAFGPKLRDAIRAGRGDQEFQKSIGALLDEHQWNRDAFDESVSELRNFYADIVSIQTLSTTERASQQRDLATQFRSRIARGDLDAITDVNRHAGELGDEYDKLVDYWGKVKSGHAALSSLNLQDVLQKFNRVKSLTSSPALQDDVDREYLKLYTDTLDAAVGAAPKGVGEQTAAAAKVLEGASGRLDDLQKRVSGAEAERQRTASEVQKRLNSFQGTRDVLANDRATQLFGPDYVKAKIDEGDKRSDVLYGVGTRPQIEQRIRESVQLAAGKLKDLGIDTPEDIVPQTYRRFLEQWVPKVKKVRDDASLLGDTANEYIQGQAFDTLDGAIKEKVREITETQTAAAQPNEPLVKSYLKSRDLFKAPDDTFRRQTTADIHAAMHSERLSALMGPVLDAIALRHGTAGGVLASAITPPSPQLVNDLLNDTAVRLWDGRTVMGSENENAIAKLIGFRGLHLDELQSRTLRLVPSAAYREQLADDMKNEVKKWVASNGTEQDAKRYVQAYTAQKLQPREIALEKLGVDPFHTPILIDWNNPTQVQQALAELPNVPKGLRDAVIEAQLKLNRTMLIR